MQSTSSCVSSADVASTVMRMPPFQWPSSNFACLVAIATVKGSVGVTIVACMAVASRSTISGVGVSFMRVEWSVRVGALNSMCI